MRLTARELSGLPGMPSTERRTRDKLAKLGIPSHVRVGRGGGQEYDCSALPPETRRVLMADQVLSAAPQAPVAAEGNVPAVIAERRPPSHPEKAVADARVILVKQLLDLAQVQGTTKASQILALQLVTGEASRELLAAARAANQRARTSAVSDRTLYRWLATYQTAGWWGLLPAPAPAPTMTVDEDVAATLGNYLSRGAQFRKLTLSAIEVTKQLGRPYDEWKTLYDRARRAAAKVDLTALVKARHTGAERAAKLPFKRRDTSVLKPLDVWLIDGHSFKAKVRHPDHGAPFAPEVTLVIDAATRMVTGWSVALSENTIAVGDALRHAVASHGVPAIVYSDNGPGESAKQFDCPVAGVMARLGTEHRTGIPGHPQGHGLIERSWQTHMIRCARQFGSYQGKDADSGTFRKVAAELAKEQRAVKRAEGTGEVIQLSAKAPTWKQFVDAVAQTINEYNNQHRHRALPKNERGAHLTPAEAWAAMLNPELQHIPSQLDTRMLFMPAILRTAKRGEVVLFNQVYASRDLFTNGIDGHMVRVHYDIHDPAYVMVFSVSGDFICEAKWNANRIDYFPQAVIEMAREKRVNGIVKRRKAQIDTALRELQGTHAADGQVLDAPTAPVVLAPAVANEKQALPVHASRPMFDTASDRYEWLMNHRATWADGDATWLANYVAGDDYEGLSEYFSSRGIDWKGEGEEEGFKSAR